jgi:hypothetical protein
MGTFCPRSFPAALPERAGRCSFICQTKEFIMRYVTLTRLGNPGLETVSITIPYNGDEFEFIDREWRRLARLAAAREGGVVREDNMVAEVHSKE